MLQKIHIASLKFMAPLSIKRTYKEIVNEAIDLMEADYGTVFLIRQNVIQRVYSTVRRPIQPRKDGFTYKVFKTKKIKIVSLPEILKNHPEAKLLYFSPKKLKIKSVVLIPLSTRRKSMGVLSLQSKKSTNFHKTKLRGLRLFASMASLAIEKNLLYNQVKNSLETRDLFISTASHELRTPLTTIYGYSQWIEEYVKKGKMPELKWAKIMIKESKRLNLLINELLRIEQIKIGNFQYNFKKTNLNEVIERATVSFNMEYRNHKLFVERNVPKKSNVYGDFNKLMQVFINLLNNSAKFSPMGSAIRLSLSQTSRNYSIKIQDRGAGITKKDIPKIFKGFYKGSKSKSGMGLGLFLAKNIIEEHEGKILIKSRLNQGTTVEIKLPKFDNGNRKRKIK